MQLYALFASLDLISRAIYAKAAPLCNRDVSYAIKLYHQSAFSATKDIFWTWDHVTYVLTAIVKFAQIALAAKLVNQDSI